MIFFSLNRYGIVGGEQTVLALDINADKVLWNHLSYRAKNLFGTVTTDVQLIAVPVKAVVDLWITDPAGEGLLPAGETIFDLKVNSKIMPLFGSDEILNAQSFFDPNGSGALQRIRLREGKIKWQKSYRFTKKGVFRVRKKPMDSNEDILPLDQWTKVRNHFYFYGDKGQTCTRILEPGSLLFIVSALNLSKTPKHFSLCVFNNKQLHRVDVSVGGSQTFKVNYLAKQGQNRFRVKKEIDTIKISFQPRALAREGQEPEVFSFLGLKGDFDIFIDKTTWLPVQISGKISTFGKLDIKLQAVSLSSIGSGINSSVSY
jgi:hypothetical protein